MDARATARDVYNCKERFFRFYFNAGVRELLFKNYRRLLRFIYYIYPNPQR